jgi:hypothetical protein
MSCGGGPSRCFWEREHSRRQVSVDPGSGFIYFAGLAGRWWKEEPRNMLLLHTKEETNDETLPDGREVVLTLIRGVEMLNKPRKGKRIMCRLITIA